MTLLDYHRELWRNKEELERLSIKRDNLDGQARELGQQIDHLRREQEALWAKLTEYMTKNRPLDG